MLNPDTVVHASQLRPREPERCYYCKQPIGTEHTETCVMREKTVVVTLVIEHLRTVPADWDEHSVVFHINESSFCSDNLITEMAERMERMNNADDYGCFCSITRCSGVREATAEDHEFYAFDWNEEQAE